MKAWILCCTVAVTMIATAWIAFAQAAERPAAVDPQSDLKLPNGKSQRDEILKSERAQNLKDAAQLVDMAKDLQQEIEKNEAYVLPLSALKKTDEIEKLAKRIRTRLRH
jgi:cell division septation protein DedD